jgi:hypothetical protein
MWNNNSRFQIPDSKYENHVSLIPRAEVGIPIARKLRLEKNKRLDWATYRS